MVAGALATGYQWVVWGNGQGPVAERSWHAPVTVELGCTLPILLGYLAVFKLTAVTGPALVVKLLGPLWTSLSEETLLRGFLFGHLYQRVRLLWLLVVVVESDIFACGHLYQSHYLALAIGILVVTFACGVWSGWLFKSWGNLWVSVLLHAFINVWWVLFEISDTAAGNLWANVFRGLPIGLSVVAMRWYQRRQRVTAGAGLLAATGAAA